MKVEGIKDYKKYRWFMTSSGKLVIGGKNAEQNEELIRSLIHEKHLDLDSRTSLKEYTLKKYIVMHTHAPGSPFSIIIDENPSEDDLIETGIFTACFSRAWKEGKKKAIVDSFLLEQIYKNPSMKLGTFGVVDSIDRKPFELKLYLAKQKGILRAVPFNKGSKKDIIPIIPGKVPKERFAEEIAVKLDIPVEQVLNALPTGGSEFAKTMKSEKSNEVNNKKAKRKR